MMGFGKTKDFEQIWRTHRSIQEEEKAVKMKYMKIGSKPDTFYTEEATRSVLSDVPTDLIILVNNTKYLLHKCGLLQRLCSNRDDDPSNEQTPVALHGIPGGEDGFELCAKFCYGMTINLSAHNFLIAISAAKFLRMTESVAKGNFVTKLESFFDTCILSGWKDTIVTLQSFGKVSALSDNPRIVRPCLDAIIEKILTNPSKVTWSFTYTRPGYNLKQSRSVPKDWWTEDVSDLDLDLFRSIISTLRSAKMLPPQLIGEALHVYACKHLPDPSEAQERVAESFTIDVTSTKHRRVLESIVSMIPAEHGSVSGRFLLRLLKVANQVGASPSTKAELVRRSGQQLDEATPEDLILPSASNPGSYDIGIVEAILDNFLAQFQRPFPQEGEHRIRPMMKVAKIFDSYLQVVASDADLLASNFAELAESLPDIARQEHDGLYKAIDIYLKEHPELSKAERKRLCRMIGSRKLSPAVRSHAITNDRLPLRTIVQLLFVDQERLGGSSSRQGTPLEQSSLDFPNAGIPRNEASKVVPQATEEQAARQREKVTDTTAKPGKSIPAMESKTSKKKERKIVEKGEGSGSRYKDKDR